MTATELIQAGKASRNREIIASVRPIPTGRGGIVMAAAVVAASLASNWNWLVAAGIAPLLISVLPCVAMCALGLCMNRMTGRSCAAEDVSRKTVKDADGPKSANLEVNG